ncbi:phosphatase PAP2 family protein [Mycobacterium uberis]|uniref:Phosphatase PAP2 family protein n=1 Tax=Mycobacterium uberis TaxID=2162698 RepID=A0A3E1HE59_9MYCO|nr:phosphatase PAP2 family protein [Mycobacterium uberis]RFD24713.1 phosphatase PAP2 family protein [Mycobacterium uberis]
MTRMQNILATTAALVAIVVYVGMWIGYQQDWGWLHSVDWSLLNAAHDIGVKHPVWVWFWDDVSFVLGPITWRVLGIAAAVVALVMRKVRVALLLLVCLPLDGFVTMAAKSLVGRPRPVTALVHVPSTSFPSGHVFETTASVLALLIVVMSLMGRLMRRVAVVMAVLSVLMVGIARVALNVHHPSDVLAGCALGYLYVLVVSRVLRPSVQSARQPTAKNCCTGVSDSRSLSPGQPALDEPELGAAR